MQIAAPQRTSEDKEVGDLLRVVGLLPVAGRSSALRTQGTALEVGGLLRVGGQRLEVCHHFFRSLYISAAQPLPQGSPLKFYRCEVGDLSVDEETVCVCMPLLSFYMQGLGSPAWCAVHSRSNMGRPRASPGGSRKQRKNLRQQPSADLGHQGKIRKVGEGIKARQQRTIGWW